MTRDLTGRQHERPTHDRIRRLRKILFAVAALLLMTSIVDYATAAGTNDHFASRRRAIAARQQQLRRSPWGGPTTGRNWWTPTREYRHQVIVPGPYFYGGGFYAPGYHPYYAPRVYGNTYLGPPIWSGQRIHIELRR